MNLRKIFSYSLLIFALFGVTVFAQKVDSPIPKLPPKEEGSTKKLNNNINAPGSVISFDSDKISSSNFYDNKFNLGLSPYLNAVELNGYLRFRAQYFRNAHLKTYIPELKRGTSKFIPNETLFNKMDDGENPNQNSFSTNMRLRLNPTINVSEVVRIKGSVDFFDNLVLGTFSKSFSQSPINVKRAWAEADFAIGSLRFGRMPKAWGLGLLYHSGDGINSDHGDQVDGIEFSFRVMDHFLTTGYNISYVGPIARGGNTDGQRYPLDSGDMGHVLSFSLLKNHSEFITNKRKQDGRAIFNYGLFSSYNWQPLDSENYEHDSDNIDLEAYSKNLIRRNAHVGTLSLWADFSLGNFNIAAEAVGVWGKKNIKDKDTWLLQGGMALESNIKFLNDRLHFGIDAGLASSMDNSDFKFNSAYTVDMLMYKEVLGGISNTFYVKPHLAYFLNRNFGFKGELITSFAIDKENTSGKSNLLGAELDLSSFLRTENGFYFQLSYGMLFPLKGLDHQKTSKITSKHMETFGNASLAQSLQAYVGVVF